MATPDRLRGRLRALARAVGASGFLVTTPASVRYLTGFTGSSGWALGVQDRLWLLTDERYRTQAHEEAVTSEVHVGNVGLVQSLRDTLPIDVDELVVEAESLTLAAAEELRAAIPSTHLAPRKGLVQALRLRKDRHEVAAIEAALELTEQALLETFSADVVGRTERELAARLDYACRRAGAERMAFDTIVAAGSNGALPHARPSARRIAPNTPIVVDCGAVLDGYCSDITRTIVCGTLDERWSAIHAAVDRARAAAIEAIRPGVAARQLDAIARSVLEQAELAEYFVHSLGHGVGLEIHEAPRVSSRSNERLEQGMVITVEPGVYIPGEAGVRLEDLVLVEQAGGRRLNRTGTAPMRAPV